jgi:hypothetical protein
MKRCYDCPFAVGWWWLSKVSAWRRCSGAVSSVNMGDLKAVGRKMCYFSI